MAAIKRAVFAAYQGEDPQWPPEGDDGVLLLKGSDLTANYFMFIR